MTIYDRLRAMLTAAGRIEQFTPRQDAAFDFLFKWLWVSSAEYGRLTYDDYRVQHARSRYVIARKLEDWPRARAA